MGNVVVITRYLEGFHHDNAFISSVLIATLCGDTRPGTLAIKRQHFYGNEKNRHKQLPTVNTEAPKTILKYY